jgi:iron complex outermembrane receptor protein
MNRLIVFIGIFSLSYPLWAQKQIQGMVVNEHGSAISYASVFTMEGGGTISDSCGNFVLDLKTNEAAHTLLIHSMGYQADTILLAINQTDIKIQLTENTFALNEFSVVAHQSIESKSSVSAFVTNKKEMAKLNPQNISQVLQTEAGFTNKSGYQSPLVLRGMSGKRILVLRNGNRRFSSYPAGVMSHTINVYDLERIEVEKGAASVIYGAGAMAGIINLVDQSPFKQKGFNGRLTSGYGSVNGEKNLLACGGWSDGQFAVKGSVRDRKAGNFTYPDGSIAENSFYADMDAFVTTGYKFSETQHVVFTADIHNGGPWGKPVGFNGSDYMRLQTQEEKSNNYSLKFTNEQPGLFQDFEFSAFYSNESRELVKKFYTAAGYLLSYVETTHFSDYYYGSLFRGRINVNEKYSITTGGEAYRFHISTPTDAVDYIEAIAFNNRVSHNARTNTSGIFMQHDIRIDDRKSARIGLRYDFTSVYEGDVYKTDQNEERRSTQNALSVDVATTFALGKQSKIKLNAARSFRMPETSELYSDSYTSNGIVYGNPDLKPEYCYSLDASYHFRSKGFKLEVSPFVWFMDDMITKEEVAGLPGTNFTYVNIGRTRLFGGEANGELKVEKLASNDDELRFRVGAAYLNGTDITGSSGVLSQGTPLNYVPPFNLKGEVNYKGRIVEKVKLNVGLRSVFYAEQKRLGDAPYATPSYFLLGGNLGVSLPKVRMRPSINLAVNNLLNTEYYCYQSYLPGEGRDVRLFVTFSF